MIRRTSRYDSRKCEQSESERRKADALLTLTERREIYIIQARRILLRTLLDSKTATVDDVRQSIELPAGINPKCFGAMPGSLARAGIIRAAGFAKTSRPEGHARSVTVWELADREAAKQWLQAHRDLPDDQSEVDRQSFLFPVNPTNEPSPTDAATGLGMEAK